MLECMRRQKKVLLTPFKRHLTGVGRIFLTMHKIVGLETIFDATLIASSKKFLMFMSTRNIALEDPLLMRFLISTDVNVRRKKGKFM